MAACTRVPYRRVISSAIRRLPLAIGVFVAGLAFTPGAWASVSTDQPSYAPGSTVTISGDNGDNAGYLPGEVVDVSVSGPAGYVAGCSATADDSGAWSCQVTLASDTSAIGSYGFAATGESSGVMQSGRFTDSGCKNSNALGTPLPSTDVGASYADSGGTRTYSVSTPNKSSSGGVPGLIEYCVYPSTLPDSQVRLYDSWDPESSATGGYFDFARPDGDPSNAPFNGSTFAIGKATWDGGTVPSGETIVLHINDAAECAALYGGNPGTCYVLPSVGGGKAGPPSVDKTAAGSYTDTFTWTINKTVDNAVIKTSSTTGTFNYIAVVTPDGGTVGDAVVTGKITLTNPNAGSIVVSGVTDTLSDGTQCVLNGGTPITSLPSGDTTVSYTCDSGTTDPTAIAGLTDKAIVTWADQTVGGKSLAAGSADSGAVSLSSVDVKKIDDCVIVSDPLAPAGTFKQVCAGDPESARTFTYAYVLDGTAGTCTLQDNTATFTTNTTGTTGSSSQTVKLCVGADLQISKTASTSYTRTYNWTVSKDVDKTLVEQLGGGTATFDYTVNAAETGYADTDWKVAGKVTLTNPNDWEGVDVTKVADEIDNGGSCTVDTSGFAGTLAAGASVELPYTCTYGSPPAADHGTNTATATWDKATAYTPDGSAAGTAGYAFGAPTKVVSDSITVTDTFNGSKITLGTLTATDTKPYASATYTYPHTVTVPTWDCVKYTNTAKIVETGQTDGKAIEVCGPAKTGALTIGFWQNKNGQGVIAGAPQTALSLYLEGFAPFADLTTWLTKSGNTVASYVTNVIKLANASGASMNAMLKAQMLATTLDVYFSDPALGGNKIGAPAPIGGVTIDLTKICKMIDSSSGASCAGSFENVSSAFGGATSMGILKMLATAAGQSNSGGSMWYGNVKAIQQLAKDAFDAVNNQVVFAP
jgi:hypothetical protein